MPRLDPVGLALVVVLGSLALSAVAAGAFSARARRRRSAASLQAIDFVRTSFTSRMVRGEPLEALLREVVEALRGQTAKHLLEVKYSGAVFPAE